MGPQPPGRYASTMDASFTYRPIGFVRTPYAKRIDAPHQPTVVEGTESGAPAWRASSASGSSSPFI